MLIIKRAIEITFLFIVSVFNFSFCNFRINHTIKKTSNNLIARKDKIFINFFKNLKDKYKVKGYLAGTGSDVWKQKINELTFDFQIKSLKSIERTRSFSLCLLIECLLFINEEKKLKEDFDPFPFSLENILIMLSIYNPKGVGQNVYPHAGFVMFVNNKFIFEFYKFSMLKGLEERIEESFEEVFEKTKDDLPDEIRTYAIKLIAQKNYAQNLIVQKKVNSLKI